MAEWDAEQYLKFADHRLRPALDLMARIPLRRARSIVDLGCGTGNVTRELAARWTDAAITGVDSSPDMLERARAGDGGGAIDWRLADLAAWRPEAPVDLVFSNAALHWLGDHATLLPRLMTAVAPGGALAVQMPRNFAAPSHTCVAETVEAGPWRDRLRPLLGPAPVGEPGFYWDMLRGDCRALDIWETEYLHELIGADPVVQWTRGTWLRPFLEALGDAAAREAFLADYAGRVAAAYPPRDDGVTLFPFRRLFLVARA